MAFKIKPRASGNVFERKKFVTTERTKARGKAAVKDVESKAESRHIRRISRAENKAVKNKKDVRAAEIQRAEIESRHKTAQTIAKGTAGSTVATAYGQTQSARSKENAAQYQYTVEKIAAPLELTADTYQGVE